MQHHEPTHPDSWDVLAKKEDEERFRLMVESVQDYAIFMLDPEGYVASWNTGAERIKGYQADEIIGQHFSCFYPDPDIQQRKPEQELQTAAATGRSEDFGWRLRKDGTRFWANVIITAIHDRQGHLCGFSKVTRDITDRKAAEDQMRKNAERAEMLIEVSRAINEAGLKYREVLNTIARKIGELVGDVCLIRLLLEDGHWLNLVACYHPDAEATALIQRTLMDVPQRADEGMSGQVIQSGQPLLVPVLSTGQIRARVRAEYADIMEQLHTTSFLIVPLRAQGQVIGVVNAFRVTPVPYTTEDQFFLQDLCDRAALAIINARLYEEAQREIAERTRAEEALAWEARVSDAIAELSRSLLTSPSIDDVSLLVLERARELTNSAFGFVGHIDPRTGFLISSTMTRDVWDTCQVADKTAVFKTFTGLWGWVLNHRSPLLTNTPSRDPRSGGIPPGHLPIHRFLGAPALIGEMLVGEIALANATRDYTHRDLVLIERMASLYALAIQRKRSEDALHESQRLLQSVISNVPVILLAINSEGTITLSEGKGLFALGAEPGSYVGKSFFDLYRNAPQSLDYLRRSLAGEEVAGVVQFTGDTCADTETTVSPSEAGSGQTFEVRLSPIRDETGAITGVIHVSIDMTERARAEEAQQQARRAAESATRAKSEFLANMSHEIRTPLNAIIGMTSLMLDTHLTTEQRDFVEIISTSGNALLSVINDILDFSKIEAGKLELEEQPFDLRICIEEALDLLATRAAEKHLDLAYFIDDQVSTTLVGDVTRLRQILVNLVSNAVKFTDRGEVVVSVETRPPTPAPRPLTPGETPDPRPRCEIHISVRDTGIGISAEHRDRLFQSFSQVNTSATRKFGGTGLGLAISKRLAEMMGGRMWVESEEGQGSTFHLTFCARPVPGLVPSARGEPNPSLRGRCVLIVDDSSTGQYILVRQVQAWGMLPHNTASGEEALNWIRKGQPFDVALLDMHMPEMDGLTLAARIREFRAPATLPIVLCTSVGAGKNTVQTTRIRIAAFLTKPVKPSHLYDVLSRLFDGVSGQTEEESSYERKGSPTAVPQVDPEMALRCPLHILLAEDNVVNQKVALRMLEKMGYRADVATNGLDVLDVLEWRLYDVVLMDVQMPEMDGLEATHRIRTAWPAERQPYIVAMTAHAMQGDRERCLESGMDDYISKPVQVTELAGALRRAGEQKSVVPLMRKEKLMPPEGKGTSVDYEVLELLQMTLGDDEPGILRELIDAYLEDTPRLLTDLRLSVDQSSVDLLTRTAHSLKSSSAQLGALNLSAICQELETNGRTGSLEGAAERIAQIEEEYQRVEQALSKVAREKP